MGLKQLMTKYLKFLPFIVILIFTVLMVSKINKTGTIDGSSEFTKSELVGHSLPEIIGDSLTDDQKNISLESYKGKYLLINVFASWCITCTQEHPLLSQLINNDDNLLMVGINWRDKKNDATNWLMEHGNPFDIILEDNLGKVGINLGIRGIPETLLVSPDGKILMHYKGNIDQKFIDYVLQISQKS
jgi:cytochrome c biogenesis protein CcmG/thiol:disulfide interchange protein DsbE